MRINLQNAGKRFNREWVFRRFSYHFIPNHSYAITGNNGSGKSTLLQVIAGALMQSEGKIEYKDARSAKDIPGEDAFKEIAIAAPHLDLIEEMSATEFLRFHATFKPLKAPESEILTAVGLSTASGKQIRYFSSGMKQRLKLAQAFFSNTSVLLLDEPLTKLDEDGISVYKKLWTEHTEGRLVIVSSNDKQEYEKCEEVLSIGDYK